MLKKLTLLALSVAALAAFAVPAAAQANATVTDSLEGAASTITATSSNTQSKTTSGTLYCDEVALTIDLSQNDTEKATGSGSGTATHEGGTHCEVVEVGAKVVTVTEVTVPHIQIDGGGHGTASFTYVYDVPGAKCHFAGTATVTYTPGTSSIKINGSLAGKKLEGEGNCASGGSISGDFTVSDEFGGEAIVH